MSNPGETATASVRNRAHAAAQGWRAALVRIAVGFATLAVLYTSTFAGLYETWEHSAAYGHWVLVLPISVYLAWTRRRALAAISPAPSALGVAAIAMIGVGWAAARVLDVNVVQQIAVHALIGAIVLAAAGPRVLRELAFPVAFLIFVVPVWTHLIPLLQDHTASAAAWSVRELGVPVFHDGYYLTIPRGQFVVAEVCAGLRFLLATLCITALYAYLHIPNLALGVGFVVFGAIVSVLTNWIRVDAIILVGHYAGMDHPLVTSYHTHLGWVIFAVFLIPLFWIGGRIADRAEARLAGRVAPAARPGLPVSGTRGVVLTLLTLVALGVGPALYERARAAGEAPSASAAATLPLPAGRDGWAGPRDAPSALGAHYERATATRAADYRADARVVNVHVAYYRAQGEGREVVSDRNRTYDHDAYSRRASEVRRCDAPGGGFDVSQWRLERRGARAVVAWHWYRVGGVATPSPYRAKLAQLPSLIGGDPRAYSITLSTPVEGDASRAEETLARFCATYGSTTGVP